MGSLLDFWSYGVGFVAMTMIQSAGDGWGFALEGFGIPMRPGVCDSIMAFCHDSRDRFSFLFRLHGAVNTARGRLCIVMG